MPYQEQPFPVQTEIFPFVISYSTGEGAPDNEFYVKDGVCYSTYSFETGSFINIKNLNTNFIWEKDQKIFIEIDVGTNLGVKKAVIKNELIGDDAPEGGWVNYPYFYRIEPQDEFDDKGRVVKIRDGKKQTKCYVLIGYYDDDTTKNGTIKSDEEGEENNTPKPESDPDRFIPVQILKENVLLIQTVVSGVPCLAPFPYFKGGFIHLSSIKQDLEGEEGEEGGEGGENGGQ